jgi:hypothetical protein
MRRIALLVLLCGFVASCTKTVKIPLSYKVETEHSATGTVDDAYVPQTGPYHLRLSVKFLEGNLIDSVTVRLSGLPSTVTTNVDSIKARPTYVADFTLTTNGAPLTVYPVTLTATAPGTTPQVYKFNLRIIPPDCTAFVAGTYNGNNACTARNYPYSVTVASNGTANTVAITNFGGYGSSTQAIATLNCNHDSLFIANQSIGNGTTVQGYGTFDGTNMTIWYSASNTPGGFPETCSATLTKQ